MQKWFVNMLKTGTQSENDTCEFYFINNLREI